MNVRVEQIGPCRRDLHVEVPADEVSRELTSVLDGFAKIARVPGFRPGRAPRELVQRRYGKDIRQEVKDRLVPRAYQHAIKEHRIETVQVIDVKEQALEEGRPFQFTVQVDVVPEFNLPRYTGIPVEVRAVQVEDADVERTLKNLREQAGRYEDVTGRAVVKGDLVQIDFEATLDGQPLETVVSSAKGLGSARDFWAMADAENSFLPGFGEALIGLQTGDQKDITIDFPADFPEKALVGRKAVYATTVKCIRERKPAEMDAKFLETLHADSVEALTERIRKELAEMREASEKRRQQGEVIQYLLKNTALEVPESQVARETHQEVYEFVQQSQYRGVTAAEIETRKEEIFDTAAKTATDRVKLRYILKRIAADEKIEATPAEVDSMVQDLAVRYRTTAEKVRADLAERGQLSKLDDDVRVRKALDAVCEKAELKKS